MIHKKKPCFNLERFLKALNVQAMHRFHPILLKSQVNQRRSPRNLAASVIEQEEDQVQEWVDKHPCRWNLKNKDFKNKAMKDRLCDDIANELGYDGKFKLITRILLLSS